MKMTCKIMTVVALCAGLTQLVIAEKIKIGQQNAKHFKTPLSYKVITKKTRDAAPVEELKKFDRKNFSTISFDANAYELAVQLVAPFSTEPSNKIFIKQQGTSTDYPGKGIFVTLNGKLLFIDNDEGPFAPTKKISVQKEADQDQKWKISAQVPFNDGKFAFIYGTVDIKKNTNPGQGLTVPKNKAFEIHVRKPGREGWTPYSFTAEEAQTMKKIIFPEMGSPRIE